MPHPAPAQLTLHQPLPALSVAETLPPKRGRVVLFLLFSPPLIAELLSGSAPPVKFFHPVAIVLLVALYGGGTLLIRELRAQWGMQWSVLLLAMAYGVLEEGTAIQSFFNHNHEDLRALSGYGAVWGVQWPWTLQLIFFHATISTLIPIAIADLLWPALRNRRLVKTRGLVLAGLGVGAVSLLLMVVVWGQQPQMAQPYVPSASTLLASVVCIAGLVTAAHALRRSVVVIERLPLLPPILFGVVGFVAQGANIIVPVALAKNGVAANTAIVVQLTGAALALGFVWLQLCHREVTQRHLVSLICGCLAWFVLLTPIHEFVEAANPDPGQGMLAVGLTTAVLMVGFRYRVLRAADGRAP